MIQSGGQRLQPEVRLRAERALPGVLHPGELRHGRGPDHVRPALRSRRTYGGRPAAARSRPDDEVYLVDEDGNVVPDGEPGELIVRGPYTLRGYFRSPEHNARAFTPDGFYRSGDLLRKHAVRQLRGRGPGQGPDQPGRREDQRGGGGEPHPGPPGRAQRGLRAATPIRCSASGCAPAWSCARAQSLSLEELVAVPDRQEIATFKLPERLAFFDDLPAIRLRQGVEEGPGGHAGEPEDVDETGRPALLPRHRGVDRARRGLTSRRWASTGSKEWTAKTEDEVVADFTRPASRRCWSPSTSSR